MGENNDPQIARDFPNCRVVNLKIDDCGPGKIFRKHNSANKYCKLKYNPDIV